MGDGNGACSDMSDEIDDENGLDDDPHTVKLRYAKNVDNPNEGVFVRCKGTLYRARKCPQCGKTFPWASSLRRHLMTHTGLKPYSCASCKAPFTTKSNLERHILRRHGIFDREGQANLVIKLSKKDLEEQMEEQKKLCDQMDQIDDVNQPDMNAMEPIQYDIEVQCDICQQMFGSKEDLDRHKVNHQMQPLTAES